MLYGWDDYGICTTTVIASVVKRTYTFTATNSEIGSAPPSIQVSSNGLAFSIVTNSPASLETFVAGIPYLKVAWAEDDFDKFTPKSAPLARATTDAATEFSSTIASQTAAATQDTATQAMATQSSKTHATATITPSTIINPVSLPTSSNSTGSSLSAGQYAGIGFGVAVAPLALCALVGWLIARKRRRRPKPPLYVDSKGELDGKTVTLHRVYEMPPSDRIEQLEAHDVHERHELDGGFQGHEFHDRN